MTDSFYGGGAITLKEEPMSISYARIVVSFHGLDFDRIEQVEHIREEIEDLARSLHPDHQDPSDIEVEVEEYAGHGL